MHDLYGAAAFGNIVSELQLKKINESFDSLWFILVLKTRQCCAKFLGTGDFLIIHLCFAVPMKSLVEVFIS